MLGRRSAGLWQWLLFLVAAITISLSVLVMHQLAVNHSFAAPATSESHLTHHRPLAVEMPHEEFTDQLPTRYHDQSLTQRPGSADQCWTDCDPTMGLVSCLLALSLLVLSWLLAPPRECPQALLIAARRFTDVIPPNKRRVSWSLAELSVCRT